MRKPFVALLTALVLAALVVLPASAAATIYIIEGITPSAVAQ